MIDYNKVIKILDNNTSALSMNRLDEIFSSVSKEDRGMLEEFFRKELKINVLDYITTLYSGLYSGTDITNLEIPETITKIDNFVFYGNSPITITFNCKIDKIQKSTFYNCDKLSKLIFKQNVGELESSAINNCRKLDGVKFEQGVNSLQENAFFNTNSNIKIYIDKQSIGQNGIQLPSNESTWYKSHIALI